MAATVSRWGQYLATLGWTRDAESAVPVLRPHREIKDAGEIAIFERVGAVTHV